MRPITKCDLEEIEENLRSKGVWQEGWEICSEANINSIRRGGGSNPSNNPSIVKVYESEEKKGERRKVIAHTTWSDAGQCVENLSKIISGCRQELKGSFEKKFDEDKQKYCVYSNKAKYNRKYLIICKTKHVEEADQIIADLESGKLIPPNESVDQWDPVGMHPNQKTEMYKPK